MSIEENFEIFDHQKRHQQQQQVLIEGLQTHARKMKLIEFWKKMVLIPLKPYTIR